MEAEAPHLPIKEVMNRWIKNEGYPLLTIMEEGRNLTHITFRVAQKRFAMANVAGGDSIIGVDYCPAENNQFWQFPLT